MRLSIALVLASCVSGLSGCCCDSCCGNRLYPPTTYAPAPNVPPTSYSMPPALSPPPAATVTPGVNTAPPMSGT